MRRAKAHRAALRLFAGHQLGGTAGTHGRLCSLRPRRGHALPHLVKALKALHYLVIVHVHHPSGLIICRRPLKGVAAACRDDVTGGDGIDVVELPAHTYAVFKVRGPMPEAFKKTYIEINTDFFTTSDYEYANGLELEVYPSANVKDPDYQCEIWIAVESKKKA